MGPSNNVGERLSRYRFGVLDMVTKWIDVALKLNATIHDHNVIKPGEHEVFLLETTESAVRGEKYKVTLAKNPTFVVV